MIFKGFKLISLNRKKPERAIQQKISNAIAMNLMSFFKTGD